ncbi:MAG: CD225/dispanin family protein [Tannerella sp.]|jgi:hypothetical protein|nr:CD225/dispanin family protein [Tannerella sp.]
MEEKEYFYLNGETKVGPLSLDALKNAPIQPDTMIWNSSLPDWVEARSLPELQALFVVNNVTQPTPVQQPTPPPVAPAPTYNTSGNMGNNNMNQTAPPMPENYLVWAILATIFCSCAFPLGIVAIVKASKVSSAYMAGDYAGAQKASDDAKKFTIWTAVIGGILIFIWLIAYFAFFAAMLSQY